MSVLRWEEATRLALQTLRVAVGRFGGGVGVNRLYPQLPGQDGDLAQAPYLFFPSRLQDPKQRGGGVA